MNSNKKQENKTTTLKSVLLKTLLFILGVNIFNAIFAKGDFTYLIISSVSSLLGMGLSLVIVYYLVNNRSFGPIDGTKGSILILFTLPFFLSISLGLYFGLNFIVNLF